MAVLEFEALLDDGVIHVPEAIAEQLAKGATLRVSIEPLQKPSMTPDEAWESILEFIRGTHGLAAHIRPSVPVES
jgi:hypothetical protein